MNDWIGFAVLAVGVVAVYLSLRAGSRRRSVRDRLERMSEGERPTPHRDSDDQEDLNEGLRGWLRRAGHDEEDAPAKFLIASGLCIALGLAAALAVQSIGLLDELELWLLETPGGFGEAISPIVWGTPYFVAIAVGLIPTLRVRRDRRRIVSQTESDLGLTLELLASLARAGLAFDAALDRILRTSDTERPLFDAFERFVRDLRGGRSRVGALRTLANRLDVPRVRTLVSALIQAERIGASLSTTLRQQADDLRQFQREQALAKAQALPAKLVFPLVICFLPAIFVWTLGPIFYQFLQETPSFEAPR